MKLINIIASFILLLGLMSLFYLLLPIQFNKPTGNYGIGIRTYEIVDSNRKVFPGEKESRRIKFSIYYPTQSVISDGSYVDSPNVFSSMMKQYGYPDFFVSNTKKLKTHSEENAELLRLNDKYPVIIYLHGHTGFRQMNTVLNEELVSQGFVVIAIEIPYVSTRVEYRDGTYITGLTKEEMDPLINRSIDYSLPVPFYGEEALETGIASFLSKDASSVIDELYKMNQSDEVFKDQLDLDRLGLYGVSMGSIMGGEAAISDSRIKAAVLIDSPLSERVQTKGIDIPTLWITRPIETMVEEGWQDWDIKSTLLSIKATKEKSKDGIIIYIKGMFHPNFTDAAHWLRVISFSRLLGPLDYEKGEMILKETLTSFFKIHLIGEEKRSINEIEKLYEEVDIEY